MNKETIIKLIKITGLFSLMLFISIIAFAQEGETSIEIADQGEKLFFSSENADGNSCASCHYFIEPDTLNWNPSVIDMSERVIHYNITELKKSFSPGESELLKKVHAGYSLNDDEFKSIKIYLEQFSGQEIKIKKPVSIKMYLSLGMVLLILFFFIDKRKTKIFPGIVRRILVFAAYSVLITIVVINAIDVGRSKNYAPVQPIKFSHQIHATDNKIECQYCHAGVLKGKNAGIPSAGLCLNCHNHVREGTRTGKYEIRKIYDAIENSKQIKWIRIHNLPDHVYFNHMQHVKVGQLDCIECHGDVEQMHIVKQVEDLSMSWCINCHDITPVDFSNEYYKTYFKDMYDELQTGKRDSVMVSDVGGRDCGQCHF